MGLLNQCVIRFTNEVEGNNFSILIYHSKNKMLKQQAEEVSFQIMSKCEKSEKQCEKIPIPDRLEYAFI